VTSDVDELMLATAVLWSSKSKARRTKVGAVIAKDGRIISIGYNGTPPGYDNCCEKDGVTIPEVVHSEANAILFCARNGIVTEGTTLYLTLSPCIECAKMIATAGIVRVVFKEKYRHQDGLELLEKLKIPFEQLLS
jgi:dCMP deaminase